MPGPRRGRPWSLFPPNVSFRENARFATCPPPAAHRRGKPPPGSRRRGSGDARGHMAISLIGIERAAHFRTFFRRPSASRAIGSTGKKCFSKVPFSLPLRWRAHDATNALFLKSSARETPRVAIFYFSLVRRAERNLQPLYWIFSFRPLAAPPGPAPRIPPFNIVSPMRGFGASAKRGGKCEK